MHERTNIQLSTADRRELEAVAANRNSPAGTTFWNQCCNGGFYCSQHGCTPVGAVECGTHYCNPGQQCSRSGGCQLAAKLKRRRRNLPVGPAHVESQRTELPPQLGG
jgi:hypothetical protein